MKTIIFILFISYGFLSFAQEEVQNSATYTVILSERQNDKSNVSSSLNETNQNSTDEVKTTEGDIQYLNSERSSEPSGVISTISNQNDLDDNNSKDNILSVEYKTSARLSEPQNLTPSISSTETEK